MTKTDDANPSASYPPDAHGQAALQLVESLLHDLTSRSVLTVADAINIVEIAHEAQTAIADEDPLSTSSQAAVVLLDRMIISLRSNLAGR